MVPVRRRPGRAKALGEGHQASTAVEEDLSRSGMLAKIANLQKQVRGLPAGPGECVALPAARPRLISNRVHQC